MNDNYHKLEKELKEIKEARDILTNENKRLTEKVQELTKHIESKQPLNLNDKASKVKVCFNPNRHVTSEQRCYDVILVF